MANVTITFDNGPEAAITHHVLDVLGKHGVKVTFFAVGRRLLDKDNRDALVRARAEGHWIGNHSYSHSRTLGSGEGSLFQEEVEQAQALIGELAHGDKLFRPFFNAGITDNRIFKQSDLKALSAGGYTIVLYDTLTGDWGDGEVWVNRAMFSIGRRPWSTMILHDIEGYPDGYRTGSMKRLDEFLMRARDAGHSFVQDFDPAQVPMRRGRMLAPLGHLAN